MNKEEISQYIIDKKIPISFKYKTFEQCLGEFLYWFELNKHNCFDIKYYEK